MHGYCKLGAQTTSAGACRTNNATANSMVTSSSFVSSEPATTVFIFSFDRKQKCKGFIPVMRT
jgi:hypothetical protein